MLEAQPIAAARARSEHASKRLRLQKPPLHEQRIQEPGHVGRAGDHSAVGEELAPDAGAETSSSGDVPRECDATAKCGAAQAQPRQDLVAEQRVDTLAARSPQDAPSKT